MNNGLENMKDLSHLLDGLVLLAVLGLVDECLFEMDNELRGFYFCSSLQGAASALKNVFGSLEPDKFCLVTLKFLNEKGLLLLKLNNLRAKLFLLLRFSLSPLCHQCLCNFLTLFFFLLLFGKNEEEQLFDH